MAYRLGPKSTKVGISQNNTQPHVLIPIKMPKFHWLTFWPNLVGARPCPVPGVDQMHLEVPWESLLGQILKIYVEIIHSEQFRFYEKNCSFMIFLTLFSENCPFLDNFDKTMILLTWCTYLNKSCSETSYKLNFELHL